MTPVEMMEVARKAEFARWQIRERGADEYMIFRIPQPLPPSEGKD
jgi:hypothetical protein